MVNQARRCDLYSDGTFEYFKNGVLCEQHKLVAGKHCGIKIKNGKSKITVFFEKRNMNLKEEENAASMEENHDKIGSSSGKIMDWHAVVDKLSDQL
jgi:hypothetical protein